MKPEFSIISESKNGEYTSITINTKKATYQGLQWQTLGDFGKRKFQNLLIMTRAKEKLKIRYV